jgi:hypothetical protein
MAASNASAYGAPPQLGTPIPGTQGGMPAQSGLSVLKNPMAQQLESQGRNGDSMLVHMTPDEVGGLQNLAMAMGGSLTINPETGLPEANFLKKLLPTLLGAGLSFIPGVGPLLAAGIVGGGQTLLTGDLNKGLMAGLQAFGGAALGGAAGAGNVFGAKAAAAGSNLVAGGAANALPTGATLGAGLPTGLGVGGGSLAGSAGGLGAGIGNSIGSASGSLLNAGVGASPSLFGAANVGANLTGAASSLAAPVSQIASSFAPVAGAGAAAGAGAGAAAKTGLAGFAQRFGQQASAGLGKGMLAKAAPFIAGTSVLDAVNQATTPSMAMPEDENKSIYEGPYLPMPRKLQPRKSESGGETQFFDKVNPYPGYLTREGKLPRGYADGGETEQGLGARMLAALPEATRNFQTSPGAITASRNYADGTPFERSQAPAGGETDFGFKKSLGAGATGAPVIPGSGGETLPTSLSSINTNSGGGANAMDLANMFGGRMTSEIASGPPLANPLPGTTIPGMTVSGQGVMPDFKLEALDVNPVGSPQGGGSSSYNREFGGPSPFGSDTGSMSSGLGSLNSMNSFGSSLNSRISGGNYTFPSDIFKDPEEFEEAKARGGEVGMDNGSFVVDARTVSELGNGSSNAGIEHLARMGGRPVRGRGDGVSDSVPARIGGSQAARVARDEVIFPAKAVARLGGGNHKRGTQKLYALMEKAHKARKQASRGQDTKVAKGLGALS